MGAYWIGLAGILVLVLAHAVAWHLLEDWVDARKHERRREVWDRIRTETDERRDSPPPAPPAHTDTGRETRRAPSFDHPWMDL